MLGVLVLAIYLLIVNWRGRPVTAAFTRAGGETLVETAVDASRFWLTPPQRVVETSANATQEIMLGAAQCAMVHDAPLLFTSPNPKRQRVVDATINSWRKNATTRGQPSLEVIRNPRDVTRCIATGDPDYANRLSTLKVPNQKPQPSQLPWLPQRHRVPPVPAHRTLAPVVVFAAALAPWYPPDIAVGFALAAHMATAGQEVSLVVVPRYLEADPALEHQLEKQHELVTGGVVLGQTPTVPEDTRTLLRQLLATTNRQDFWSLLQADLGTLGSQIAALLALLGLGAATTALVLAFEIRHQIILLRESGGYAPDTRTGGPKVVSLPGRRRSRDESAAPQDPEARQPPAATEPNWFTPLGNVERGRVTVMLRSGWQVTGDYNGRHFPGEGQDPANVRAGTVVRLDNAMLECSEMKLAGFSEQERPQPKDPEFVLVQVGDIELITRIRVRPPAE
jgi:hypothetical protein